jgi:ribosomal-protein-alanine N-acetyltransferase
MDRNVPALTLTTEHLVLRPVGAADNEQLLAHWTSPQVRQFMFDGEVLSVAGVCAAVADSSASFTAAGYGLWLISERQAAGPAEMAGTAGLRPLEDLGLEIIWSLAPAVWGRGYATEAARAVLDYALDRLGMTAFAVVPGLLGPMTCYRRTR